MNVVNNVNPTEDQLAGFGDDPDRGPIHMVNLLKFRDKAAYADGSDAELSGREAYDRYSAAVAQIITAHGGGISFFGNVSRLMLGEVEELWDQVAIAWYPSRKAMMDMINSEEYQAIHVHREAGLAGQLNIETVDALVLGTSTS